MKSRVNFQQSVLVLAISQIIASYSIAGAIPKIGENKSLVIMPRVQIKVENFNSKADPKRTDNTGRQTIYSKKATNTKGKRQIEDITVGATVPQGKKPETNYTVRSTKSATKLDLAPKDTPQSITNFTQQIMKDQNMETVGDLLNATPGVSIAAYGVPGPSANSITARGFKVSNYQIDGMMVNEWALGGPMAVGNQDSFLYENIDLVRGSVGLLTGTGDPSASINFTRKKPYAQNQGQFNLKYGSWNNWRQELDYSMALNKSRSWRARVGLTHENGEYHIDRAKHKGYSAYAVTELDLGDSSKFTLGANFQQRHYNEVPVHGMAISYDRGGHYSHHNPDGTAELKYHVPSRRVWNQPMPRGFNNATRWSYTENKNTHLFTGFQHYFSNNWQLEANYNYARSSNDNLFGIIGKHFFSPEVGLASYDQGHVEHEATSHSVDVALKGQFDFKGRAQQWVLGVNGFHLNHINYPNLTIKPISHSADVAVWAYDSERLASVLLDDWFKGASWYNREPRALDADSGPYFDPRGETLHSKDKHETEKHQQYGLYFAAHLRPVDTLSVILGGRYNRNKNTYSYSVHPAHIVPENWYTRYWVVGKPKKSTFSPYLGLIYHITPDINAYASYVHMVTVNTFGGHIVSEDGGYVPPVINKTLEAGLKAGFYDNRLNLALAYFNMQQDNYPIVNTSAITKPTPWGGYPEPLAIFDKGYSIKGGELSINGEITPRLKLMAGYVYQSHKKPPKMPLGNQMLFGFDDRYYRNIESSFVFPRQTFKLFASYQLTEKWLVGGGLNWQSATTARVLNSNMNTPSSDNYREDLPYSWFSHDVLFKQKAYAVYSLMASYRINKYLTSSLNISNLTNQAYYTNDIGSYRGEPRKITLQVGMKF